MFCLALCLLNCIIPWVCVSIQESGRCWREPPSNDSPLRWDKTRKDVLFHNFPWLRTFLLLLFLTSRYTRWSNLRSQGLEWQRITELKTRRGKGLWVPRGGYSEKKGPICRGISAEESWALAVSESPGGSGSHSHAYVHSGGKPGLKVRLRSLCRGRGYLHDSCIPGSWASHSLMVGKVKLGNSSSIAWEWGKKDPGLIKSRRDRIVLAGKCCYQFEAELSGFPSGLSLLLSLHVLAVECMFRAPPEAAVKGGESNPGVSQIDS